MKLFIFDMGGVVTGNVACIPAMAASFGITADDFFCGAGSDPHATHTSPYNLGDVGALMRGSLSPADFWLNFSKRTGIAVTGDPWRTFFNPIRIEGTYMAIEALKSAGYRVVCGTNSLNAHYAVHTERGEYDCFHKVYASQLMGIIKPDPAFWEHILHAEHCPAEETFFVDDNQENVSAAIRLGLHAHLFTGPENLMEALDSWAAG